MKKLTKNEKIGITISVLLLLGGGGFAIWYLSTRKKRECEVAGGTWDSETKSCKMPVKEVKEEIIKKAYDNLTFASGSDKILETSFASLDDLAEYLKSIPALSLTLNGHTDSQGDEDYNQNLSEKRANAVKKYLIGKGIDEKRITAKGFGETQPIASNATAGGRKTNRRVEFIIG